MKSKFDFIPMQDMHMLKSYMDLYKAKGTIVNTAYMLPVGLLLGVENPNGFENSALERGRAMASKIVGKG